MTIVWDDVPTLTVGQPQTEEDMLVARNEQILAVGTKPRPWSHTALENFNNCPRQFHEVKVLKHYTDIKGVEALWGERFHLAAEKYLKREADLDPELEDYRPYLDAILYKPGTMHVELDMAMNSKLQPCGTFDKGVFVRGIVDVLHINGSDADAIDHKTGKRKPNSRQMMLMALLIFAHYPQVMRIRVAFEWLKFGTRDSDVYTRKDIPNLWNEFLPNLKQYRDAFVNNVWQPRQSGLCAGWCPVTTCEFWKPKRVKK